MTKKPILKRLKSKRYCGFCGLTHTEWVSYKSEGDTIYSCLRHNPYRAKQLKEQEAAE